MAGNVAKVHCVIAGAGVIGLAVARAISKWRALDILVLESGNCIGGENSSRNSEVIHAGLYYKPGSLKSSFCISGRKLLKDYLISRNINHSNCGKIVVASTPEELIKLNEYFNCSHKNGALETKLISPIEAKALEPNVRCVGALWSPFTGYTHLFELKFNFSFKFIA